MHLYLIFCIRLIATSKATTYYCTPLKQEIGEEQETPSFRFRNLYHSQQNSFICHGVILRSTRK